MKKSVIETLEKEGKMRQVKKGIYELTGFGQERFGKMPKPQEGGIVTEDNLQKMLLDAGLPNDLEWEDDPNRKNDRS